MVANAIVAVRVVSLVSQTQDKLDMRAGFRIARAV
jgi:hypothetical protein